MFPLGNRRQSAMIGTASVRWNWVRASGRREFAGCTRHRVCLLRRCAGLDALRIFRRLVVSVPAARLGVFLIRSSRTGGRPEGQKARRSEGQIMTDARSIDSGSAAHSMGSVDPLAKQFGSDEGAHRLSEPVWLWGRPCLTCRGWWHHREPCQKCAGVGPSTSPHATSRGLVSWSVLSGGLAPEVAYRIAACQDGYPVPVASMRQLCGTDRNDG